MAGITGTAQGLMERLREQVERDQILRLRIIDICTVWSKRNNSGDGFSDIVKAICDHRTDETIGYDYAVTCCDCGSEND